MERKIWFIVVMIVIFIFSCNKEDNSSSVQMKKISEVKLPKVFYKHFIGEYFDMPSAMNITVIDTNIFINLVYKPKYNVITAVTNLKEASFTYHIISNFKTRDTLETWIGKFIADTFLTLRVFNPFRDSVYQFYENYQNSVKVNVYYFDTTVFYQNTDQEIAIVQINSLDIPQLNFDFLLNQQELKKLGKSVLKDLLKASKYYNPNSDFYFYPLYYNKIMAVEYNENNLLVVSDNTFAYYGGAHGISKLNYYNINLKNKTLIKLSDVIVNQNKIKKLAYQKLTQKNIPLFVNEKTFYLTKNFFILGSKIVFVYNTYEIAPYYLGEITIEFQFKEIKDLLNPKFLKDFFPDIEL